MKVQYKCERWESFRFFLDCFKFNGKKTNKPKNNRAAIACVALGASRDSCTFAVCVLLLVS